MFSIGPFIILTVTVEAVWLWSVVCCSCTGIAVWSQKSLQALPAASVAPSVAAPHMPPAPSSSPHSDPTRPHQDPLQWEFGVRHTSEPFGTNTYTG